MLAKNRAARRVFLCYWGSLVSLGTPLGPFWLSAGRVRGRSNFPGRHIFRLFGSFDGFQRFQRMSEAKSLFLLPQIPSFARMEGAFLQRS